MAEDTRGWSEEDWEAHFRRQDGSYFASLIAGNAKGTAVDRLDTETGFAESLSDLLSNPGAATFPDEDMAAIEGLFSDLGNLPAWRAVVEFCDRTMEFAAPICAAADGGPRESIARILCSECYLVAEYVVAGHELGYEESALLGNVALCRRAKGSLDRCIECIGRLGSADDEVCQKLVLRGRVAGAFLDRRIADLRKRAWWRK